MSLQQLPTPPSSSLTLSHTSGSGVTTKHPFKYPCPFCGKKYTSRSGLLSHKNTVHYQRKPYRCEVCNEHFFTSAQRVAHIHKCHVELRDSLIRNIGEKGPGGGSNLITVDDDEDVLAIEIDDDSVNDPNEDNNSRDFLNNDDFMNMSHLSLNNKTSNHSASNSSRRPLAHKDVPMQISHKHDLTTQAALRPATSEMAEYACDECAFSAGCYEDLLRHLDESHPVAVATENDGSKDKSAKGEPCLLCPTNTLIDNLSKHMIEAHVMGQQDENLKPAALVCGSCRRSFHSEAHRRAHDKYHHPRSRWSGAGVFECPKCLERFAAEPERDRHMHGACGGSTSCVFCGLVFLTASVLVQHVREHHHT